MSFHSPCGRQSHTAAATDPATGIGGSKRASPHDDLNSGDESKKRVCSEIARDQDSSKFVSSTRSTRVQFLSPPAIAKSPSGSRTSLLDSSLDNSPTPTQSAYDINISSDDVSCEDSISREASDNTNTSVRGEGLTRILHRTGFIDAGSDYGFDHSSYLADGLLDCSGMDIQSSADDSFAVGSTSSRSEFEKHQDEPNITLTTYETPGDCLDPPEGNGHELDTQFQDDYTPSTPSGESVTMTGNVVGNHTHGNTKPDLPCDTCFGVLLLPFRSSLKVESGNSNISVKMVASGNILKLTISDSGKYAGIFEASALCSLLQNSCVTLTGTLSVTKRCEKKTKQHSIDFATQQLSDCSLRVLVCGQASAKRSIGQLLSAAELYLQHPNREEVGGLKYNNPHFLLRPGFEMPPLEQLSIISDVDSVDVSNFLDESSISLAMRVFDSEGAVNDSLTTEVSDRLQAKLKDYQRIALAMMQEKECGILDTLRFPSLWQCSTNSDGTKRFRNIVTGIFENVPKPALGGILADEMGLGKTLSVLSLVCWSLDVKAETNSTENSLRTGMTLVVAPKSTINGWQNQIKSHIKPNRVKYAIFHGTSRAIFAKSKKYNIILTTYETLRSDWSTKKVLYSQQWDRVVLDEAHHIRSPISQIFKAACELQAPHRWCLSGTPICNSLEDYGSLLTFVGVKPFADRKAFKAWILDPIKEKRPDGFRRLESLVRATCLRRKKFHKNIELELPTKSERIHWVELSQDEQDLYQFFKLKTAKLAVDLSLRRPSSRQSGEKRDSNIVTLIKILRRICDHGKELLPPSALEVWNERTNDSLSSAQLQTLLAVCDWCKRQILLESDHGFGCEHVICVTCMASQDLNLSNDDSQCPKCAVGILSTAGPSIVAGSGTRLQPSAKVLALLQNLNYEQRMNSMNCDANDTSKSLVFSVWTKMLDLVQNHLQKNGINVARIDGSCSLQQRSQAVERFTKDPSCTIMLASIGSAGEGIDLVAANHVHLLEPHWNPMQEVQAIDRVHRIGQQREVHITRYLTLNSIETVGQRCYKASSILLYVQWIQQEKIRLINQTLDSVHVSQAEIDEKRWEKLQQYIGSANTDAS